MKYDITIIRTVINSDITSDEHTKHQFREADTNFTVLSHHIPGTPETDTRLKHLVEFNPDDFMDPEDRVDEA